MADPQAVLACPLRADFAPTVGDFLKESLIALWVEEESFSGKRPLGNSGWQMAIGDALARNHLVSAKITGGDEYTEFEPYVEILDWSEVNAAIRGAIEFLFCTEGESPGA